MHSVYYLLQAMLRIDDLLSHSARSVTNRKSQKMRNSFTATGHPVQDVPDWLAALWRDMTSHISGLVASTHLKNMQICFGIMKIESLWNHHWLDSHLPAIQLWSVCNACVRIRICLQTIYILTSAAGDSTRSTTRHPKWDTTTWFFPSESQKFSGEFPLWKNGFV